MKGREVFSPAQVRMARAGLNWTAERLAARAGMELEAVELFEDGGELSEPECKALGQALNGAGVIAIPASDLAGEGIRFNRPSGANGVRSRGDKAPARFRHLSRMVAP